MGSEKGSAFAQIACSLSSGHMELLLFSSLLPPFFSPCLSFGCVTASLCGVLRAGEVREERIPLVPPRPSHEMGFFGSSPLSRGHGGQEEHGTERREAKDRGCTLVPSESESMKTGQQRCQTCLHYFLKAFCHMV